MFDYQREDFVCGLRGNGTFPSIYNKRNGAAQFGGLALVVWRTWECGSRTDSFLRNIPGYGDDATWPIMGNGTNGTTLGIYTKTHGICQFGGLPKITWTTSISGSRRWTIITMIFSG